MSFSKNIKSRTGYEAVLEIDYSFDEKEASEPLPGISINLLNMIDASLVVYGEGKVGFGSNYSRRYSSGYHPYILSHENPHYEEYLDKDINADFVSYFRNFKRAYDMRPLAFDLFRRSKERYTDN